MDKRTTQEDIMTLAYQIARHMRKQMGDSAQDKSVEKVSPYQLHVLFTLCLHATTMGELAAEMNITLPSATSLVDRLVKSGWVTRQPDPDDRRIIRLSVTEAGRTLLKKRKQERYRKFKFLLDAMPEADVKTLHRIFTDLHATLEQNKTC